MGQWKRAHTPAEKQRLLEELTPLWAASGDMRLGQLLYNAMNAWLVENKRAATARDMSREIFYVEDDDLLTTVAKFVKDQYPPKDTASTSS